jgi:hypothetical protein
MGHTMNPYRVWNIVILDLFCNTRLGALNTFPPLAPKLVSLFSWQTPFYHQNFRTYFWDKLTTFLAFSFATPFVNCITIVWWLWLAISTWFFACLHFVCVIQIPFIHILIIFLAPCILANEPHLKTNNFSFLSHVYKFCT